MHGLRFLTFCVIFHVDLYIYYNNQKSACHPLLVFSQTARCGEKWQILISGPLEETATGKLLITCRISKIRYSSTQRLIQWWVVEKVTNTKRCIFLNLWNFSIHNLRRKWISTDITSRIMLWRCVKYINYCSRYLSNSVKEYLTVGGNVLF